MQFFLHIILQCLASHKNGKFMDILKCILCDFDKKSGYFLFVLSLYINDVIRRKLLKFCILQEERLTG